MTRILFFALMLFAIPALAEPIRVDAEPLNPVGVKKPDEKAPPVAEEKALSVEEQAQLLCQTTQIMGSTAGADYQPGVDAYGHAVAPADANAGQVFTVPERIDIPLSVDLLNTVGVENTPTPALSTHFGTISILKGGRVLYNDRDMTTNVQDYCNSHPNVKAEETK